MASHVRRPICRLLFLLGCLMPTFLLGVWILVRSLPGHRQRFADHLSQRLGLRVELTRFDELRPGMTQLGAVRLFDPESHQLVASVERMAVLRKRGRMLLDATGTIAARDQLPRLWELLHLRILRQKDDIPSLVILTTRELVLRGREGDVTLRSVRAGLERTAAGPKSTWRFVFPGSSDLARIDVMRDCQSEHPVTRFALNTGTTPLPCSLLEPFCPPLRQLGPQAVFQGRMWTQRSADGWDGELSGHLGRIDLARLVSQASTHRLTGHASMTLEELRFRGSQIESARGTLSAGPGEVGKSLLDAAVQILGLIPSGALPSERPTTVPYGCVNLAFVIDAAGLTLYGQCPDVTDGTVMAGNHGPLLQQPRHQPIPVVSFVRALVPQQAVQVPATQETVSLLRVLPLPPLMTRAHETSRTGFE